MSSDVQAPRLLTVKQLAAATGIPRWRWHELFTQGNGPEHLRIGKTIRVSETALARWIAEREQQTNNTKGEVST